MTDLNFFTRDMKKFLQDIATEQQFDVTYFDITDNPHTGISAGVTSWGLLV